MMVDRIQSRTSEAAKKLTIKSIKSKQSDIPEAKAEVVDIPVARYVDFVDLTSSTRRKAPRWSPQNHVRPQKIQTNSLLNVFEELLTRLVRDNPDNCVLDPSGCECPTCPYSTGCLATQRFVLLERCYQIENVFKDRPELYGWIPTEDVEKRTYD